jgi:hypothetical protein
MRAVLYETKSFYKSSTPILMLDVINAKFGGFSETEIQLSQ